MSDEQTSSHHKKTNKQLILNDYIIPQKHSKLFEKKRLFA